MSSGGSVASTLKGYIKANRESRSRCSRLFLRSAVRDLTNAAEFWPEAKDHCDGVIASIRALQERITREGKEP